MEDTPEVFQSEQARMGQHIADLEKRLDLHRTELDSMEKPTMDAQLADILSRQIASVAAQARIEAGVDGIREHLRVLNGTTAKSVGRIDAIEQSIAVLQERGVARQAVDNAVKAADDQWKKKLAPFVWLFFIFILGLILGHAGTLKGILGIK